MLDPTQILKAAAAANDFCQKAMIIST